MKVLCTLLLLLSFCSCKQKQEQKQRDPDNPSNYSLVLDFCEEYTIDPLETFSEDYIPYCYLEIKGKTYDEIVDLFGSPLPQEQDSVIFVTHPASYYDDSTDILFAHLLHKCGKEVTVYSYEWTPRENRDIVVLVYFVRDGDDLRAFYGEQLNRNSRYYSLE